MIKAIKDKFYSLSVQRTGKKKHKPKSLSKKMTNERIFIWAIFIVPLLNAVVLYLAVNFNYILLAFQQYDIATGSYRFAGFKNIVRVVKDFSTSTLLIRSGKNSMIAFAWTLFFTLPVSLLVSYTIYKKIPGSGVFRIVLFLPQIVSSIVWVIVYKAFVETLAPAVAKDPNLISLFLNPKTSFSTIIFYTVWMGFAANMIVYTGAMARIPPAVVEAAKLDGITPLKEFWYITLPMVFSTVSVFIILGVVGIFTNQLSLFAFYNSEAGPEVYTIGYYFFTMVYGGRASLSEFPYAAAAGIVFTAVALPITFLIRHLLEKYGPNAEY